MKLICGLGNPGSKYELTRHNMGFLALDSYAKVLGGVNWKEKDGAYIAQAIDGTIKVLLVKPWTYMNCSGEPLQKICRFYKVVADDLIVVHDELDLKLGRIQVRKGGGNGGHNGLKSIDQQLKTKAYLRIRIGIGRPVAEQGPQDPADWVLSRFRDEERDLLDETCERGARALQTLVCDGLEDAQRQANVRKV